MAIYARLNIALLKVGWVFWCKFEIYRKLTKLKKSENSKTVKFYINSWILEYLQRIVLSPSKIIFFQNIHYKTKCSVNIKSCSKKNLFFFYNISFQWQLLYMEIQFVHKKNTEKSFLKVIKQDECNNKAQSIIESTRTKIKFPIDEYTISLSV